MDHYSLSCCNISFCFSQGIDDKVLVEIFLEGGSEFTAIVLDVGSDLNCQPVVLLPTEVMVLKYIFALCVVLQSGLYDDLQVEIIFADFKLV